jgi:hypothetical protein
MSCRDVRRVVSEYCLFGEQEELTTPHLDHLSGCRSCQDEAGIDRALVRELRRALAARVEGAAPSAGVWQVVLRRAQTEEAAPAGWRRWLGIGQGVSAAMPMMARLRTASVLSTMALAVMMANGQNSMPALPAPVGQVQVHGLDQFERQTTLPVRIELPAEPEETTPIIIPRRQSEERLVTPPPPPTILPRVAVPIVEPVEDDEDAVGEDEAPPPRIIWHLYPPALDPAADPVDSTAGSDGAGPIRAMPGEPT